jgi:hypothetical protein
MAIKVSPAASQARDDDRHADGDGFLHHLDRDAAGQEQKSVAGRKLPSGVGYECPPKRRSEPSRYTQTLLPPGPLSWRLASTKLFFG